MNTKIKNTIKAVVLALGLCAVGSAQAFTAKDVKEYAAEMPELSYQLAALDCSKAGDFAARGAWWAIHEKWDVRKDPKRMAMYSTFEVLEVMKMGDFADNEYIDRDNPRQNIEEILETYRGFFLEGAAMGAEVNKHKKGLSEKEKRAEARSIGVEGREICLDAKEHDRLKEFNAIYKLAAGEF